MSQENLQRVREQYARYNAGERAPGRWFWHEDAEYHTAREDPDHAAHRGIDAIGKLFASGKNGAGIIWGTSRYGHEAAFAVTDLLLRRPRGEHGRRGRLRQQVLVLRYPRSRRHRPAL